MIDDLRLVVRYLMEDDVPGHVDVAAAADPGELFELLEHGRVGLELHEPGEGAEGHAHLPDGVQLVQDLDALASGEQASHFVPVRHERPHCSDGKLDREHRFYFRHLAIHSSLTVLRTWSTSCYLR